MLIESLFYNYLRLRTFKTLSFWSSFCNIKSQLYFGKLSLASARCPWLKMIVRFYPSNKKNCMSKTLYFSSLVWLKGKVDVFTGPNSF